MAHFWYNFKNKFVKPFHTGYLPEKDGHSIYFQQVGNPTGIPVIVFHGGPGGSCNISYSYSYDLKKYRVILFDQRGCGKSICRDPLYKNTIQDTVQDAARLLDYLNVTKKVVVAGCSWGTTCGLLFAETFPKRVERIVIYAIFLGRKKDFDNVSPVTSLFYPDVLDKLQKMAGKKSLDDYFSGLLFSDKRSQQEKALRYYKEFEHSVERAALVCPFAEREYSDKDVFKFRIYMHYKKHHFFLRENQLLKDAKKISGIPTYIYQNRWDPMCPPYMAYELYKALPKSKLNMIPSRGHISEQMFWQVYLDNKKTPK